MLCWESVLNAVKWVGNENVELRYRLGALALVVKISGSSSAGTVL